MKRNLPLNLEIFNSSEKITGGYFKWQQVIGTKY
jgi:hypothetical protein